MAPICTLPVELLSQCCDALKKMEEALLVDFELASYLDAPVSAQRSPAVRTQTRSLAHADRSIPRPASALVALSETCHDVREVALPFVWRSLWLTLDFNKPYRCVKHCLSILKSGHPAQKYAKDLTISIKRNHDSISAEQAEQLDTLLAHCVYSMPNTTEVYVEIDASRHSWPSLLLAIMRLPNIRYLQFNGTAGVQLPRSLALPLKSLIVDAQLQRSTVDFLCFPALTHLTLGLEDVGKDENWKDVVFPREMWTNLLGLELYGYCRRPDQLFSRIRTSMHRAEKFSLQRCIVHLAFHSFDLDVLFHGLERAPELVELQMTVPSMVEPSFVQQIAESFPKLRHLGIFQYTAAAAWCWPGALAEYANALRSMRELRILSVNVTEFGIHVLHFPSPEVTGVNAGLFELTDDEKAVEVRTDMARGMGKVLPALKEIRFEPSSSGKTVMRVNRTATTEKIWKQIHVFLTMRR